MIVSVTSQANQSTKNGTTWANTLKLEYNTSNGTKYNSKITKNDHHPQHGIYPQSSSPSHHPADVHVGAWSCPRLLAGISILSVSVDRSDVAVPKALPRMNVS
jgi:hypothetical protein